MARRQRAAGAGGAGGDREARPVQLVQQRLPVDIETGEGDQVRQPPHRIADHLDVRHQLRHPRPDPVHQRPQPGRLRRRPRPAPPAARPPRPRSPGGSRSRRRGPTPVRPAGPGARTAPPCVRRAARRPPGRPTCGRSPVSSDQAPSTGPQPSDCAASTSSGTPAARHSLGHLRHRLHGAHLVVGGLQAGQRGVRPQRRRRTPAGDDRAPPGPPPTSVTVPPARLVRVGRVQHRGVFDRGDDQLAVRPGAARRAPRRSRSAPRASPKG